MRIATYNIENLDEKEDDRSPMFEHRAAVLRPALERLQADLLCLQEVHGQETPGEPRQLLTLKKLLAGTRYENHQIASTTLEGRPDVYDVRNLVTLIPAGWTFEHVGQLRHDIVRGPQYRYVTSTSDGEAVRDITWERPLLYTVVQTSAGLRLHVINVHFKSKLPTNIPGQKRDRYSWRTAAGWAEGFFVSSMKRVGAALEARLLIDQIFDQEPGARVIICGDFNADTGDVPVAAVRGQIEETGNDELVQRVMIPCESSVPESRRFSLYHHGRPYMLDHLLVSRSLIDSYRFTEIHNETLHDESVAFASDLKFPESDHAPIVVELAL